MSGASVPVPGKRMIHQAADEDDHASDVTVNLHEESSHPSAGSRSRSSNERLLFHPKHHWFQQLEAAIESDCFEELDGLLEETTCSGPRHRKSQLVEHANSRQETPLFRACQRGFVKTAAVLLKHGADPNAKNFRGDTPGSIAHRNGHTDCLELLVKQFGNSIKAVPELFMRRKFEFEPTGFRPVDLLGSGSFGTVIRAEYTHPHEINPLGAAAESLHGNLVLPAICSRNSSFDSASSHVSGATTLCTDSSFSSATSTSSKGTYALKFVSKAALVESNQVRHVLDERNVLYALDSPFCVRMLGSWQTKDELVMVTEVIEGCDLWSVIYEQQLVPGRAAGVPHDLTCLYTAGIVFALDHIHSKQVVYRDLKPENVMITAAGYPCLVDFGFAKQVPYQDIDSSDRLHVHSQTFTLCGTPEYVSPELLLNSGHDKTTDLWSLGVLLYEMIMGRTPFLGNKRDDVTQLFTNIVLANKNGLELSPRIDDRAGKSPHARSLILQLLSGEPSLRLTPCSNESKTSKAANTSPLTRDLLKHSYFTENLDTAKVYRRDIVPSFIPPVEDEYGSPSSSRTAGSLSRRAPVRSFNQDQLQFAGF